MRALRLQWSRAFNLVCEVALLSLVAGKTSWVSSRLRAVHLPWGRWGVLYSFAHRLRALPHYVKWGSVMWTLLPGTLQDSRQIATPHPPHYRQWRTIQSKCFFWISRALMDEDGARYFTSRQFLTLNSGTTTLKPAAIHSQETLHFSPPRCSYLDLVWYPFLDRQMHCTNTCHYRNSRWRSGVRP